MLQRLITPQLSSQIVDLLMKKHGWSVARIAKKIGASRDYVLRVSRGVQNFEFADVESLAKECKQNTHLFVFGALEPDRMTPDQRGLYELTSALIASHQEFARAARRRRSSRKKGARAKAA